jgi:cytochrome P450
MNTSFYAGDPVKLDDPYADFAVYRREEPVLFHAALGQWFVFRHEDVSALFKDERLSANRLAGMRQATPVEAWPDLDRIAPYFEGWVLMTDGPEHRRIRGLLHAGFNPGVIRNLQEKIRQTAQELLMPAEKSGRMDAAADYAFLMTAYVLADFLGVHPKDRERVVQWAMDFIDFFNIAPITVETTRKMVSSGFELIHYTKELLDERRLSPREDFLGSLVKASEGGGGLNEDEMVGNAMLLLLAGHIAVRNLVGNTVWLLLQHPDQRQCLMENPGLLHGTVEESLRFETPVAAIPRVATQDIMVRGKTIPKGSLIQLVISSANRDDSVFARADTFDITRPPGNSLSFGTGPHACLGALLAREECSIAIEQLLQKFPDFQADPSQPVVWYRNLGNRGPERLPLLVG